MPEIVSKPSRMQDIRVQSSAGEDSGVLGEEQEVAGSSLRHLADLHGVRKAIVDKRGLLGGHNLRDPGEPSEGGRVEQTILVAFIRRPVRLLVRGAVVTFRPQFL